MEIITSALAAVVGIFWILCRFDLRKVAGCALWIDITMFIVLPVVFIGSYGGMMTAVYTGIFLSLGLTLLRKFVKPIHPRLIRFAGEWIPRLRWVNSPK